MTEMPGTRQVLYADRAMQADDKIAVRKHGATKTQKTPDMGQLPNEKIARIFYGFYPQATF